MLFLRSYGLLLNNRSQANEAMGIKSSTKSTSPDGSSLPAFSEHILKIEKLGPEVSPMM